MPSHYRLFSLVAFFLLMVGTCEAQRLVGQDTVYADEWIVDGQEYLKVTCSSPGVYAISFDELEAAGWTGVRGEELQLWSVGVEQPIHVSQSGAWSTGDRFLFVVDDALAREYDWSEHGVGGDELLSPWMGTYNQELEFFLTRTSGTHLRYAQTVAGSGPRGDARTIGLATSTAAQAVTSYSKPLDSFNGMDSHLGPHEGLSYGLRTSVLYRVSLTALVDSSAVELIQPWRAGFGFNSDRRLAFLVDGDTVVSRSTTSNEFERTRIPLAARDISSNRLTFVFLGLGGSSDRYALGQPRCTYARTLGLTSAAPQLRFQPLPDLGRDRWLLSGATSDSIYLLDAASRRLSVGVNGDVANLAAPMDATLFLALDNQFLSVASLEPASFGNTINPATDYLIVSSRSHGLWPTGAGAWEQFRASVNGGNYQTQTVYIEDLYNRFAYGDEGNARAIRTALSQHYRTAGNTRPHVLLLGKGRQFVLTHLPALAQNPDHADATIPTVGMPGADNLLAVHPLTGEVTANIGRIAVTSSEQVATALAKVQEAAAIDNLPQTLEARAWTKRVLHLVGGGNPNEQAGFQTLMRNAANVLERSRFGSSTTYFFKDSNSPVQQADSEELFASINEGFRQISFLGHGSQSTLDFNIDNPERYDNGGRLPLFFAMGCFTGNVHTSGQSIGERFLLEEEDMVLGFGATVGLGYAPVLTSYLSEYYRQAGEKNFGGTVGEALALTNELFLQQGRLNIQLAEQFTYQGDPASSLSVGNAPDYTFDDRSFALSPSLPRTGEDTVSLAFEVANLGANINDTLTVVLERAAPGVAKTPVDTVSVVMTGGTSTGTARFVAGQNTGGLNEFTFRLYADVQGPNPAAMLNDQSAPLRYAFIDNQLDLVWPKPGMVVDREGLALSAQLGGLFDGTMNEYQWQLSDNPSFQGGSVVDFTDQARSLSHVDIAGNVQAGQLYYARVRTSAADSLWVETHFTVEEDAGGASIRSREQFERGDTETLRPAQTAGWTFGQYEISKSLRNTEFTPENSPAWVFNYDGPAGSIQPWRYLRSGIAILVSDSLNGQEIFNQAPGQHGSINGGGFNRAFMYPCDTRENRNLAATLLDSIAEEYSILWVFTCYRPGFDLEVDGWLADSTQVGDRALLNVLRKHGAQHIDDWAARGTVPYTAIYQKGVYGMIAEDVGNSRDDLILTEVFFKFLLDEGTYRSERLAMPDSLQSFAWDIETPALADTLDVVRVTLVGHTRTRDTVHVFSSSEWSGDEPVLQLSDSLTELSVEVYQHSPELHRAYPINYLKLNGTNRAELAFDPLLSAVAPDTTLVGGRLDAQLGIRNLANVELTDSIRVTVSDATSSTLTLTETLSASPTQVWEASLAYPISTSDVGERNLVYEMGLVQDLELSSRNNSSFATGFVKSDETAPAVNVTYLGEVLQPEQLIEQNPTLLIDGVDVGAIGEFAANANLVLTLTDPQGQVLTGGALPGELLPVDLRGSDNANQVARWEYRPGLLSSGVYTLQARLADASDNRSGSSTTSVTFEIDDRNAVSAIVPYPNPMVDRVRFHYELTGIPPDQYQIDVYTTSGRLVRSLGPTELGTLRVGRNLTEFAWDGTTEFGEQLAAGTYLYRFSTRSTTAQEQEHRATAMDQYNQRGFGKLVILP